MAKSEISKTKELFLQKDFLDALNNCNSQFDLFEAFPLSGL